MKRFCFLAVAALSACGGTSSATSHNNPGTGTTTLAVTADVTATISDTPVTNFQVDLRDGTGARVSGATVTIVNAQLGPVTLVEATQGTGRYVNASSSIPAGDFALSVLRATDRVDGVVVGGPGVHVVNAPAVNATVPANQPLVVSWTTPSQAKTASISTRDFSVQAPDTGTYTIPAISNPPRTSQRLTISRFNETDIAGGLSGSRLRVTFNATVDPYVVQ